METKPPGGQFIQGSIYYFRPAIPICLALMGGIYLGDRLPGGDVWALGFALCGVALILRRVGCGQSAGKMPLCLLFFLGYFSLQPYVAPILPSRHVINFADGVAYQITGRVVTDPLIQNNRQKLQLSVESLSVDGGLQISDGNLRLTVYGVDPKLAIGDRIRFRGRIKEIRNFNNPGGFDYKRHMAFKGVRASTYCRSENILWLNHGFSDGMLAYMRRNRAEIERMIADVTFDRPETRAVLSALLIGRKTLIPKKLREDFNRCGIGHLLAISGLHVGSVALVAFWLFRKSAAYIPAFLRWGIGQRIAAVAALIPVAYYGWLAGFSPSTQRAVFMVLVLLGAYVVGRRGDIINTLAWAAVVILIFHPPTLFSISFQLSFMAVLAIILGLQYFKRYVTAGPGFLPSQLALRLLQIILVSFFALLGTLPLTMHYFNQISLLGPFANLLFVPLLGFLVVPMGLTAIFIHSLSSYLATGLLYMSAKMVDFALALIKLLSGLPWISLRTFTPSYLEIVLYFLFLALLLGRKQFFQKNMHIRRFVLWGLLLLTGYDVAYWTYVRFFDEQLRVTALDVGQGSATLLELPRGKTMLVDGGGFNDNQNFDVGARIVAPFLWRRKIQTVDVVVLTHPNSDHLNGLLYVLENFSVHKVLSNRDVADTSGYQRFQKLIHHKKIAHPDFRFLCGSWREDEVTFDILSPPKNYTLQRIKERWRNSNNNSLVLKVSYGRQSLLFPGDLMKQGERALLSVHSSERLKSNILMVPHHGSKSSSSRDFVETVAPDIAVMSTGWQNPFGFPHHDVLSKYQKIGADIMRTDQCGAIQLALDGKRIRKATILPCPML